MRIITWNIGGGNISSKGDLNFDKKNLEYFIEEIKTQQPDIVCLQEVHSKENYDQAQEIAEQTGMNHYTIFPLGKSHLNPEYQLGLAIISKHKILSAPRYTLPRPNLYIEINGRTERIHNKGILEVSVSYKGQIVRALSGHMTPFRKLGHNILEEEFSNIRKEVNEAILQSDEPTIFCVDLNNEEGYKVLEPAITKGFKLAYDETTPTTPKGRKYDKILCSKHWQMQKTAIIPGKADHYLCIAEMDLKKI